MQPPVDLDCVGRTFEATGCANALHAARSQRRVLRVQKDQLRFGIRELGLEHVSKITELYVAAAASGTLGRDPDEYDEASISVVVGNAVSNGFCLGAFDEGLLCGEVHAARVQPRRFFHVFSGLTAAVHPDYQGRGIGRHLLQELLRRIDALDPRVSRIELMLQDGNPAARLYADLGFREEGRLVARVKTPDGTTLDDIQMGRVRH